MPHKDQTALQTRVLPALFDQALAEGDPVAERDCTVLVRGLLQGVDPLYFMEICPQLFASACKGFNLTVEQGRDAIERAHWQGPGIFFADGTTGLPETDDWDWDHLPVLNRQEALWLFLAGASDCTEHGYSNETTFVQRLQRQAAAIIKLTGLVSDGEDNPSYFGSATRYFWDGFIRDHEFDDLDGIVLSEHDHAFWLGYKAGHKAVAVQAGDSIFIGTTPDTTLEEQGILVDKLISDQFGIRFDASPEE